MDNQATRYTRTHYTLIGVLKDFGGLQKVCALIALLLMKPFIFKKHDLQVFLDHIEKKNNENTNSNFSYNQNYLNKSLRRKCPTESYLYLHNFKKKFSFLPCFSKKKPVISYSDQEENQDGLDFNIETLEELSDKMSYTMMNIYDMESLYHLYDQQSIREAKIDANAEQIKKKAHRKASIHSISATV